MAEYAVTGEQQEPAVQIQQLTKKIGRKTIIDDLSFELYPGEIFGFLGPNGAGKTTTIRMMVGLISISKGDVIIQGKSIKRNFEDAIIHIGAIVENPEMYKFLSGYRNLKHYARMIPGVSRERIQEVIQQVGLEQRIYDKVKTYSLGMRQRLGLAQALLHNPSVLVLDEPTNGLDPAGIREFRDYLRKISREQGVAVMVSSHLLSEMELMCDRVGIIQHGKLIGIQTVKEMSEASKELKVQFTVNEVAKAEEIITEMNDSFTSLDDQRFEIMIDREQIPRIVELLVESGVSIYGIVTMSRSLEDRFLEVTGGKGIV